MVKRRNPRRSGQAKPPSLGVVIVAYGHATNLPELLRRLGREKQAGDQVVVVDNHPGRECAAIAEQSSVVDTVIRSDNHGFAAGCNKGVAALPENISLILLLNPDILPEPGAVTKLRLGGQPDWGAWMGLLALPDGRINSAGNVVHISGLSWCGAYGGHVNEAGGPKEIKVLSGACTLVRRAVWERLGGLAEDYFLYYEDTDFSVTLWRNGFKLGIVPSAVFVHDYVFDKGTHKWFYLERNRYVFIVRQWPFWTVMVLLPALIAFEIGFWAVSLFQGRFFTRIKAVGSFLVMFPGLVRARRSIQKSAPTSSRSFLLFLQPTVDTGQLNELFRSRFLNNILRVYYSFAKALT